MKAYLLDFALGESPATQCFCNVPVETRPGNGLLIHIETFAQRYKDTAIS